MIGKRIGGRKGEENSGHKVERGQRDQGCKPSNGGGEITL